MGVVCCRFEKEEPASLQNKNNKPRSITKDDKDELKALIPRNLSDTEADTTSLFQLLGNEIISQYLASVDGHLLNPETKKPSNVVLDEPLKIFNNSFKLWLELTDLPTGNKLHNYYSECNSVFTPELHYLCNFQTTNNSIKALDDNVDNFELVSYAIKDDIALLITKTRTKKILMIDPKTFFVVRLIRRINKNEFVEFQKSVELTALIQDPKLKSILDSQNNVGKIHVSCVKTFIEGEKRTTKFYSQMDVLSGVGALIVKTAAKGKLRTFQNNQQRGLTEFLLKTTDFKDFIWYTHDQADIRRIFYENLIILKNSRIQAADLKMIPDQIANQIEEQLSRFSGNNIIPSTPSQATTNVLAPTLHESTYQTLQVKPQETIPEKKADQAVDVKEPIVVNQLPSQQNFENVDTNYLLSNVDKVGVKKPKDEINLTEQIPKLSTQIEVSESQEMEPRLTAQVPTELEKKVFEKKDPIKEVEEQLKIRNDGEPFEIVQETNPGEVRTLNDVISHPYSDKPNKSNDEVANEKTEIVSTGPVPPPFISEPLVDNTEKKDDLSTNNHSTTINDYNNSLHSDNQLPGPNDAKKDPIYINIKEDTDVKPENQDEKDNNAGKKKNKKKGKR